MLCLGVGHFGILLLFAIWVGGALFGCAGAPARAWLEDAHRRGGSACARLLDAVIGAGHTHERRLAAGRNPQRDSGVAGRARALVRQSWPRSAVTDIFRWHAIRARGSDGGWGRSTRRGAGLSRRMQEAPLVRRGCACPPSAGRFRVARRAPKVRLPPTLDGNHETEPEVVGCGLRRVRCFPSRLRDRCDPAVGQRRWRYEQRVGVGRQLGIQRGQLGL